MSSREAASPAESLDRAKSRCIALTERISQTLNTPSKISDSCQRTLLRLVNAELRFLSRLSPSHLSAPISVNVGYLESIVQVLRHPSVAKVSCVCKPVASLPPSRQKQVAVHVDVVCTLGRSPAWFLVSDRNPKYISWSGSHRNKGLRARVEQVLAAARSAQSLKPESIVLFFCNGVGEAVGEKLVDEFGASEVGAELLGLEHGGFEELEDGWVNVIFKGARVFQIQVESDSQCLGSSGGIAESGAFHQVNLKGDGLSSDDVFCSLASTIQPRSAEGVINFDTTALVALVSGISNGGIRKLLDEGEAALRKRFKGNYEFVMAQVESELQNPILMELRAAISGKKGIVCESVCLVFSELISMCGGPKERLRADHLLNHLELVPDCPSARVMGLPTTRKTAMKNKIVFGTGDYWRAPTLTANTGFVRAISQTGMSLLSIEHRPRALTGD